MDVQKLFEELQLLDEHPKLEAKLCTEISRAIKEAISAFSNEPGLGGGALLLGVEREEHAGTEPKYVVRGISNPDRIQADLASFCSSGFNVPIRPQTTPGIIDGKVVIGVEIPEVSPSQKPVYLKSLGISKGAFRRIGSSNQVCSDEDISLLFDGRGHETFDVSIIRESSIEDIDLDVVEEYRRIRQERGDDPEVLSWSDLELLDALGCIKQVNGKPIPTVVGIIVFGTKKALRKWFPLARVDYIRVRGNEWIEDPNTRFESIELRDSLFRLIQKAQGIIIESLPTSFSLIDGGSQRTDSPLIPTAVIREAVVNSLIHRNYKNQTPVQIIKYSDRIEIRNPGYSIKSIERLGEPGSFARNPHIAQICFETKFAENKGSGVRAMQRLMTNAGLSQPLFESDRESNQFKATFRLHHFLNEETLNWLSHFKMFNLSPEETHALVHIKEAGVIDNLTFRTLCGLDTLSASSKLRHLRDLKLLAPIAKGSATFYVPTQFLLDPVGYPIIPDSPQVGIQPLLLDISGMDRWIGAPESQSQQPSNSGYTTSLPDQDGNPLIPKPLSHLEPQTWAYKSLGLSFETSKEIQKILNKFRPGRFTGQPAMIQCIFEICSVEPLTSDQIATILRRAKEDVLKDYLTPMISSGRLEHTLNSSINNSKQCYRAITKK